MKRTWMDIIIIIISSCPKTFHVSKYRKLNSCIPYHSPFI